MPDVPQGDEWVSWIIGTLVTVVLSVIGTVVGLAKKIQMSYQEDIKELKETLSKVLVRSDECEKDRTELKIKVAKLEATQSRQAEQINNLGK